MICQVKYHVGTRALNCIQYVKAPVISMAFYPYISYSDVL